MPFTVALAPPESVKLFMVELCVPDAVPENFTFENPTTAIPQPFITEFALLSNVAVKVLRVGTQLVGIVMVKFFVAEPTRVVAELFEYV